MANPPPMYDFFSQSQPSAAIPTNHAAAPSTTSFTCYYCPRAFDTFQALGGHQNAHPRQRAARQQQPALLRLFPDSPGMFHTPSAPVFVGEWQEPIQLQPQQQQHQNLPSSSVPQGVSTADALSSTTEVDDSANMDLTLRL